MKGYIYSLYDSSKTDDIRYIGRTIKEVGKRL